MTIRIWARSAGEAALMVSPATTTLALDATTYTTKTAGNHLLPFTTDAALVECLNCDRLMHAAEYIHPAHPCVPPGHFLGDELDALYANDIAVNLDAELPEWSKAGAAATTAGAAIAVGVLLAAVYATVKLVEAAR